MSSPSVDKPRSAPGGIPLAAVLGALVAFVGVLLLAKAEPAAGAACLAAGIVCLGLAAAASAVCAEIRRRS